MYSTVDVPGRSRADGGGLYGSVTVVCTVDVSGRSRADGGGLYGSVTVVCTVQ